MMNRFLPAAASTAGGIFVGATIVATHGDNGLVRKKEVVVLCRYFVDYLYVHSDLQCSRLNWR